MKIAVFINTPAQVNFYKNIIRILREHGHEVKVLARDYGETLAIIESIGNDYHIYSKSPTSKFGKALLLPFEVKCACQILRKFKPEIITGFGIYDAFSSGILGAKCIIFEDSEPEYSNLPYALPFRACLPFADTIITPSSFRLDMGKKQIRVNSFKELAYLHPNYFNPDKGIRGLLGLDSGEEYALLRFNGFNAVHDFGIGGFSRTDKIRLVTELEKYARVFISSEAGVPNEIADRVLRVPKSRIHDVIYFSKLMIADTGTMVTEAACLGTPAIMLHPRVRQFGNFAELEKKYNSIFGFDQESILAFEKAIELIRTPNLKEEWIMKRTKLLKDKIDLNAFMVWFIENYPDSFKIMSENPRYQDKFNG